MSEILNGYCPENIFHKVKLLRFQVRNSSFETLFPTTGMKISKQIRNVWLFELEMFKHIWLEDFPLGHPLLQDLEKLSVSNCPSLISLVPSSTSFTKLTSLRVDKCKKMIYLITSTTAKSLVQLQTLKIMNSEMMLDVVKLDEEKLEEDIIFENLEYLEFTSLSSLRSFCCGKQAFIFPSLLSFIVKECPQMKIFSSAVTLAPCLTKINVGEENMRWKGDLNTTIEQMFIEKVHNVIIYEKLFNFYSHN